MLATVPAIMVAIAIPAVVPGVAIAIPAVVPAIVVAIAIPAMVPGITIAIAAVVPAIAIAAMIPSITVPTPAVAVARAVAWGNRIVVMDEPTAALGVRESGMVLELIRGLRGHGIAVIMISHNLPEVFAVSDRITVMRLGQTVPPSARRTRATTPSSG